MSEEEVKRNRVQSSNKRISMWLRELEEELKVLEQLDGMAYIETLTEVKMKIRKLQ